MKQCDGTPAFLPSSLRLFLRVLAIVFLAEGVFELLLQSVRVPSADGFAKSIMAPIVLTILIAPFLWWFAVRPLRRIELEHVRAATIVSSVVEGIITINEQGLVESFNPAAERIFGYGAAEVVGKPLTLLIPERYRESHYRILEEVCATGRSDLIGKTLELRALRKDGSELPVELLLTTSRAGKESFCTGIVRDITERKRAEEALRASQQLLERTFKSLRSSVFIIDADTVEIVDCNPAASVIFGYSRQEMLGRKTAFLFVDEATRKEFRGHLDPAIEEKGFLSHLEFRMKRKDGTIFPTEHSVVPLEDERGKRVGWVSVVRDITERKQAEEALRESEEKFRNLVEKTSDWVWEIDERNRYTYVSPRIREILGYAPEEVLGKAPLDLMPAEEAKRVAEAFTGQMKPFTLFDNLNLHKDGRRVILETSGTPIFDSQGVFRGYRGIDRDITERKRAEEELKRLHEEAERRRHEAEAFATLVRDLAASLELDQVLERLVAKAQALGRGDLAFLALLEADTCIMTVRAQTGESSSSLKGLSLRKGQGMAEKVLETGVPLVTSNYLQDTQFTHDAEADAIARAVGTLAQAAVPVVHEGTPLGVLLVARRTPQPFTPVDVEVLTRLADAASLACHHALLYLQATRRAAILEQLWQVGQVLSQSLALPATMDLIVQAARELLRSDHANLALWDATTECLTFTAMAGGEGMSRPRVLRLGEGGIGTVAATRRSLIMNDYQAFPHRIPELTTVTATVTVPLLIGERLIGTMCVGITGSARTFSAEDLQLLELLAQPAAIAIENARLHTAAVRRGEELEALLRATRSVMSGLDLQRVLDQILTEAAGMSGCPNVKVFLVDRKAGALRVEATHGMTVSHVGSVLPLGTGLTGLVAQSGQPVFSEDFTQDPRNVTAQQDRELGFVTYLGLPIRIRDEVLGVLTFRTTAPRQYTPGELAYLTSFADQAAIAIENSRLFEQVRAARERLQILSQRMMEVQEAERRHIARELHDEIGQVLTAVKINLQAMQRLRGKGPLSVAVGESIGIVERAIQEVRNLSLDLRPSVLDDLGLVPALRSYVDRQAQRAGFVVQFVADPPELRAPSDIETACFRVAQEALTNVVRHAQARRVRIEVRHSGADLELLIQDDGVGFDLAAARKQASREASLGLLGMEERVHLMGGQIVMESAPGRGTTIRVRFPLTSPVERRGRRRASG